MSKSRPTSLLLYSFDAGNGTCKGVSSEVPDIVQFEPTLAPITTRRGIQAADERPTYSLRVGRELLVFGIDDVFAHGKRTAIRRLNSQERYTSEDYFRLLQVLFLHTFPAYRGENEPIAPTGVISVPVSIYNTAQVIDDLRGTLVGQHEAEDAVGCCLRLDIQAKRLLLLPESYGALMHYAYDGGSLKKRPEADTRGTTLVVDVGYETTDLSLFEGLKFQRDRAESVLRAGMGVAVRTVHEYTDRAVRGTDVSRIDRALRAVAGKAPGVPKVIEPTPGVTIDVQDVYDSEIEALAARIAQEVLTRYPEAVSRILLAGGGAYHLFRSLRIQLAPLSVEVVPDADVANVLGGFTALKLQASRDQ